MIIPMPGIPGRAVRPAGHGGRVPLQTRVPEDVRRRYDHVLEQRGISLSRYLEELINLDPMAPPPAPPEDSMTP